ncbi:MAG: hypothetical protein IKR57_01695 [Bacilli bacterium]|nr:hypothetical protein [Bacilli bacterium]
MKVIKENILEYLTITIQTKRNMRKRIYQLEDELKEAKANERYAIEQMNKYKTKYKESRKKNENR